MSGADTTATVIEAAHSGESSSSSHEQHDHHHHAMRPLNAFHEAAAGGFSAAVSRAIIAPLDVLKIRFQVQEHPISAKRRQQAKQQQQAAAAAAALQETKLTNSSSSTFLKSGTTSTQLLSGAAAPAATGPISAASSTRTIPHASTIASTHPSTLHIQPVSVAVAPQYASLSQAVRLIIREEGVRAFWKGNLAAQLMVVPYGAVSFAAYQWSKHHIDELHLLSSAPHHIQQQYERPLNHLISGSFTGAASTLTTYPLDLLRTRFACQQNRKIYNSISHAAITIFNKEGVKGFFTGMWPTLCGIVPFMAVQFTVYEQTKRYCRKRNRAKQREAQHQQSNHHHHHHMFPTLDINEHAMPQHCDDHNNNSNNLSSTHSSTSSNLSSSSSTSTSTPTFRTQSSDRHPSDLTMIEQSVCGCIAGCVGKLVTMPMEVIKRRFQVTGFAWEESRKLNDSSSSSTSTTLNNKSTSSSMSSSSSSSSSSRRQFRGVIDCARGIVRHEGWRGLFKGTTASLLKAGPNSALLFSIHSIARNVLRKLESSASPTTPLSPSSAASSTVSDGQSTSSPSKIKQIR